MTDSEKKERGALIVEATIVFPIMFIIIFLMLFAANAYFQKCKVEAIVQKEALAGAAYCSDPMLNDVITNTIPDVHSIHVKPYRYLPFLNDGTDDEVEATIRESINNLRTGFFTDMLPTTSAVSADFKKHFLYSAFDVEVTYKIKIPLKMLWVDDYYYLEFSSCASVPVSDTPEFIRNVDMVEDYLQRSKIVNEAMDRIHELTQKAKEWLHGGN